MTIFKNDGNVWLVKTHYYDDGEHFYEFKVCKDYDTAKALYKSILDEINESDRKLKGFKENPQNFDISDPVPSEYTGCEDVYCIQTLEWDYWVEVTITKEDILAANNENNQ